MRFAHRIEAPLSPAALFERLRHFGRLYPEFHAAHQPHAPGTEPALLGPGVRFELSERFGPEHRRYAFEVTAFAPEALHMALVARVLTTIGPLRIPSTLHIAFDVEATASGAVVHSVQTVSFGAAWLDRLLDRPWLWRGLSRHADEECAGATRALLALEAA